MNIQSAEFPIPDNLLPERLSKLLKPGNPASAGEAIVVTEQYERDPYGPNYEYVHMLMAAVPEDKIRDFGIPSDVSSGTIMFSTPDVREKGGAREHSPSVSGYDYIVASLGTGSYYGFSLADKVWLTLGLVPRTVGGNSQKIIYDDLREPVVAVAQGEVSNEFYYTQKRNVRWTMRNDYLRKYLWMRNLIGVRVFFYEANLDDVPELRVVMNGKKHIEFAPENATFRYCLMEHENQLRLQVWAAVPAVDTTRCESPSADGLIWPGHTAPMTPKKAKSIFCKNHVFLKDNFLERYEQNSIFKTVPYKHGSRWYCTPSYGGQWNFTECTRVGRNLIKVPMRKLYEAKPEREICHAHFYAISEEEAQSFDPDEEHIVEKTNKFLEALLRLSDALVGIASILGISATAVPLCGFDRQELSDNGWFNYPVLSELAAVAPLEMTEKSFLARCKLLNESLQKIPNGKLRKILEATGFEKEEIKGLGLFKLLQALYSIIVHLNENGENATALSGGAVDVDISVKQQALAPLFKNYDLRIADSHANPADVQLCLTELGFDVALLNDGHGLAIDFMFDQVTGSLNEIASQCENLITRK